LEATLATPTKGFLFVISLHRGCYNKHKLGASSKQMHFNAKLNITHPLKESLLILATYDL